MVRLAAVALGLWSMAARADVFASLPPLGLYQARTIVTGTDMRSRPAGMAACLSDVLEKVAADPSLPADPRLATLDAAALSVDHDYVDRMGGLPHHDEQGSSDRPFWLTVRFDPERIAAALHGLGRAPYTGPRPTVVPLVVVAARSATFLLATDAPLGRDHAAALAAAADRAGIGVALPDTAALTAGLADAGPVLHGTLAWSDAAHGWIADWQTGSDHPVRWGVRGVSFDEAYRVGLRGALAVVAGHAP